jgi:PAS domain S-box-containing protein
LAEIEIPRPATAAEIEEIDMLARARFHLAAIVDSADDGIISKDLTGHITSWNKSASRMFGYSADEMVGHSILKLIPPDLHYEEAEILSKLRAGERIEHYETTRMTKSGIRIEISATISPIRDELGRIIGASKIVRDISDRKRMERLLIQSEKLAATGRMAASIAHEINNPLESVMNLVYLARSCSPEDGEAGAYLRTAEAELARVSHIARQTLGYYRDSNAPGDAYIHDLIENVLTVYRARLMSLGITVDKKFNDHTQISISKGEFIQCISNLIANAIDAMPRGGTLHICATSTANGVETVVRDEGTGIPAAAAEKAFDAFYTTKGDLGTGLGLWVTRQLVEKRGGKINLASSTEPENSGTTVTIVIPFKSPKPALAAGDQAKSIG